MFLYLCCQYTGKESSGKSAGQDVLAGQIEARDVSLGPAVMIHTVRPTNKLLQILQMAPCYNRGLIDRLFRIEIGLTQAEIVRSSRISGRNDPSSA